MMPKDMLERTGILRRFCSSIRWATSWVKLALGLFLLCCAAAHAANWIEILGPSRAQLPFPQPQVVWRGDLNAALKEAQETKRPLFVTLRCLPCKQCASFDQAVLEGGDKININARMAQGQVKEITYELSARDH